MVTARRSAKALRRGGVGLLIVILVAGGFLVLRPGGPGDTKVVAYFDSTDGIYAGDEVRVLGVPVGKIDSITPETGKVRVVMHVDGDVKLPADVHAALVAPSLVSSRYIQLAPRYESGPTFRDGGTIAKDHTAVPVEWDQIKGELNDLAVALGPQGANKEGALSNLVDSGAAALGGQGDSVNTTISRLAAAIRTLDTGGDDAFSTVRNLQVFVSALADSDAQIAEFTQRLDETSDMLASDKLLVRTALRQLAGTVGVVEQFVKQNRGQLKTALTGLADVTSTVAKQQGDLAQILHVAPNALSNLAESYHQRQNAVGVDLHAANIQSPGQLLCGAIGGAAGTNAEQTSQLCSQLIGQLLDQTTNNPQSQQLLEALLVLLGGGS